MMIPDQALPATPAALAGMQVVIWGVGFYGGGVSTAQFCSSHGAQVQLLDQQPPSAFSDSGQDLDERWQWHQGDGTHQVLRSADLIIASPAIPPRRLPQNTELRRKICSDVRLFLHWHHGQRIGVTGTKGKSSCAHYCADLCRWPLIGNSQTPVLQHLSAHDTTQPVVMELSSFQLWSLQDTHYTFDCGIITLLDRDHLDWHTNLDDYERCKFWLAEHSAFLISADERVRARFTDQVHCDETALQDLDNQQIRAAHQRSNAACAVQAARHLGIADAQIRRRFPELQTLPHRCCTVHQCGKLRFIDDSAATTPVAVRAAIASISKPAVFILGGHNKNADFTQLADDIQAHQLPCVLLGAAAAELSAAGIHGPVCESLEAAMECAVEGLDPAVGGSIVLSPGCASFGMYRNYIERGEAFASFARLRWPAH